MTGKVIERLRSSILLEAIVIHLKDAFEKVFSCRLLLLPNQVRLLVQMAKDRDFRRERQNVD